MALWNGTPPQKFIETEDRRKHMKDVENHSMETKSELTVTIYPETKEDVA